MNTVFIAVGSNLNDPISQALDAIESLKSLPQSQFIRASSLYSSSPMGPQDQPDYINAIIEIETSLTPIELLNQTQAIELGQGRVRKEERWGARTLDLDILLYAQEVIESERLTVPHYGMKEREFVIYPLLEIAPNLYLPCGTKLKELTKAVPLNGLHIWQA